MCTWMLEKSCRLSSQAILNLKPSHFRLLVRLLKARSVDAPCQSSLGWINAGGDDFDNVIVEWLIKDHLKIADGVRSPVTSARLKALAERAKVGTKPLGSCCKNEIICSVGLRIQLHFGHCLASTLL